MRGLFSCVYFHATDLNPSSCREEIANWVYPALLGSPPDTSLSVFFFFPASFSTLQSETLWGCRVLALKDLTKPTHCEMRNFELSLKKNQSLSVARLKEFRKLCFSFSRLKRFCHRDEIRFLLRILTACTSVWLCHDAVLKRALKSTLTMLTNSLSDIVSSSL